MKKMINSDWEYLSDTPEEFDYAIKNAVSKKERTFFEKLRDKFLHEIAASNDVLMNEKENPDGLYILRIGTDSILIGRNMSDPKETSIPIEFSGIFMALKEDIYNYVGRHVTLLEWLRERDYHGIRYDGNNDNN